MNAYKDTLSRQDIERLKAFWAAQDVLGTTWSPALGQYQPDLVFDADQDQDQDAQDGQDTQGPVNPSLASQEPSMMQMHMHLPHWHGGSGPYEPTQTALDFNGYQDEEKPLAPVWVGLCLFVVFAGPLAATLAFFFYVIPWLATGLLWVAGQ